jgi:thiol-disulfide isomerase/thioredoxin
MTVTIVVILALLGTPAAADEAEAPPKPLFPEGVVFHPVSGGGTVTIDDFRGRPILLTFWASWCGPCRVELPELSSLYGELAGKGFVLMTVNVDRHPAMGQQFLDRLGLNLPVYRLDPRDTKMLGVDALPANILLDQEGRFVQAFIGYTPQMVDEVRRLVLELTAPQDE